MMVTAQAMAILGWGSRGPRRGCQDLESQDSRCRHSGAPRRDPSVGTPGTAAGSAQGRGGWKHLRQLGPGDSDSDSQGARRSRLFLLPAASLLHSPLPSIGWSSRQRRDTLGSVPAGTKAERGGAALQLIGDGPVTREQRPT